jgi:hypothetical protein
MMFDAKQHQRNRLIDKQAEGKFDRMAEVVPAGQQGVARIDHFTLSPLDVLASLQKYGEDYVPEGRYARLKVNGTTMMVDTPMERRTNLEVVEKARGRVLIAGLGLGMILRSIQNKPEVTHITVLEKHRDVIDLVGGSLARSQNSHTVGGMIDGAYHLHPAASKISIIEADVFAWSFAGQPKFDTIYFDIWPRSSVQFLPEMDALYKRYRPLLAKGGWMDSWTYKRLKAKKVSDSKFLKELPRTLEQGMKDHSPELFAVKLRMLLDDEVTQCALNEADKNCIRQFAANRGITL